MAMLHIIVDIPLNSFAFRPAEIEQTFRWIFTFRSFAEVVAFSIYNEAKRNDKEADANEKEDSKATNLKFGLLYIRTTQGQLLFY